MILRKNLKFKRRGLLFFGITLFLLFSIHSAHTQVNYYTFSESTVAYAEITGGTTLGSSFNNENHIFTDPTNLAGGTAVTGPGFNIGFNFIYRGILYDRFGISNNGWICLGKSIYGNAAVDLGQQSLFPLVMSGPANDTLRARISAFGTALKGNGTTSSLKFETIGNFPNRTLVIQWKNYKIGFSFESNSTSINFQIRLNESDQSVELRYGTCSFLTLAIDHFVQVGLGGLTPTEFSDRETPTYDWNATTPGTNPGSACRAHNIYTPPISGKNFKWVPAPCVPPGDIENFAFTTSTLDFQWTEPYTLVFDGYEFALTISSIPPASGDITFSLTAVFSGLSAGTQYYFHIRSRCDAMNNSVWITIPAKTLCETIGLPYLENFDGIVSPELPICIRSSTWETITFPNSVASQPNAAIGSDWLFLPGLELSADSACIILLDYGSYVVDSLFLFAGSSMDVENLTVFDTLYRGYPFAQRFSLFTADSTGTYYFAFRSSGSSSIDNIEFRKYTCFIPENFQVVTNQPGIVTILWSQPSSGAMSYQYQVGQNNEYPFLNTIPTEDTSITLNNLNPSTTYELAMRSACGNGIYSPWTFFQFLTVSANDECADAIELIPSAFSYCDSGQSGSTIAATPSGQPVNSCGGIPDDDVWFRFVASYRSHRVILYPYCPKGYDPSWGYAACAAYTIEMFSDSCSGAFIHCDTFPMGTSYGQFITTDLVIGKTYYLRVFGTEASAGGSNFTICVASNPIELNDECAGAQLAISDESVCQNYSYGNLAGTTPSNSPSSPCPGAPYYDLWYKFQVIDTTQIIDVSFSHDADGVIEAFSGTCGAFTSLGCSNITSIGNEMLVLTNLTIGDTVYVRLFDATGAGIYTDIVMCVRTPNANEECSAATEINSVTGILFSNPIIDNTYSATGNGSCNGYFADDDLWYRFSAQSDRHLIVVKPNGYTPIIQPVIEFFNTGCNSSGMICTDAGELLMDSLTIGEEYFFRVYSAANISGKGEFALSVVSPPSNLTCSVADTLPVNAGQECVLTHMGSTIGTGLQNEVWYTFTATNSSHVIQISGAFGELRLYADCDSLPIAILNQLADLSAQDLIPGNTYFIQVKGFAIGLTYYQGDFTLCILTPPLNDDCEGAFVIAPHNLCDSLIHASNIVSTPSVISGSCFPNSNDIWYKFVATSTHHNLKMYPTNGSIFCRGELYRDSCSSQPLICFGSFPFQVNTSATFNDLTIGSTYYLRLMVNQPTNGSYGRGTFDFCLSTPPLNDECSSPVTIIPSLTKRCNNSSLGSTVYATNPLTGPPNVWYRFIAFVPSMAVQITSLTIGFDPGIRFWETSVTGGEGDQGCVGTTIPSLLSDDTHIDGQPEVLVVGGMTPGKEYLIEIFNGDSSENSGDYQLCVFNPGNTMKIYSTEYETFNFPESAPAGKWHQAVTKITLRVSGAVNTPHLTNAVVNTNGSTDLSDILAIGLYYDPKTSGLFFPFGKPGSDLSGYPAPLLLGQPSENPVGQIEFTGNILLTGGAPTLISFYPVKKRNYTEYIYLVYDVNCEADPGNILKGHCTSLTFDDDDYTPFEKSNPGLPVSALDSYDTRNDGPWENGATWMCGIPPPNGYANVQTNINHLVSLNDTAQCGNLSIKYLRSLTMNPGSLLTLGRSSMGALTGYSNKFLDCENGSLYLNGASLNVNGRVWVGNIANSSIGTWSAVNSILNIDGNDGTQSGSSDDALCIIATSNFVTDNFKINILDPSYENPFTSEFIYEPSIYTNRTMNGTLKFGGGDDTTPGTDNYGFTISTNGYVGAGYLVIDSVVVNGGTSAQKRQVFSAGDFLTCKHLKVEAGSEFVGRAAIQGNLVNNGLMTIQNNSFLSFCGDVNIVNHYTNVTNSQSISGTGFFRSSLNDPIPTSQLDNEINDLYVANTYSGLQLTLPLGVKNILRIRQGNIHSSDSSLLTLGNEVSTGLLVTNPAVPHLYDTPPFSGNVSTWDGGIVDGPIRRWYNGTPTGQATILPLGKGILKRPASLHFNNTANGYVTAEFIDEDPGLEGLPLVNEQDTTITSTGHGFWRIDSSGVTGLYTASVNASGFTYDGYTPITELSNVRLIKRPTGGLWENSGSTTITPPASLSLVSAEGLSGFSDFGIGVDYCRIVTNGNDDGPGSLRFAIEQCSDAGDIIFIADYVDSIFLTSDTIIFDKNLTISCNGPEKVIIRTSSVSPVFRINNAIQITLDNIEIHSGQSISAKAFINDGTTILNNVNIINTTLGEIPLLNNGVLEISGTVQIKNN